MKTYFLLTMLMLSEACIAMQKTTNPQQQLLVVALNTPNSGQQQTATGYGTVDPHIAIQIQQLQNTLNQQQQQLLLAGQVNLTLQQQLEFEKGASSRCCLTATSLSIAAIAITTLFVIFGWHILLTLFPKK